MLRTHLLSITLLTFFLVNGQSPKEYFTWEELPSLPAVGSQSEPIGVAGPIAGIHNGVIIAAGGANFNKPYWENEKEWHDDIWVLTDGRWVKKGNLEHPVAYGAVVSTNLGVVNIGGSDSSQTYDEVLLLQWDQKTESVLQEKLPSLPRKCAYAGATILDNVIYVAGGTETTDLRSAMKNFWMLDLSRYGQADFQWKELPSWPGPERALNIVATQHNGKNNCIYVFSGRRDDPSAKWDVLADMYEFDPAAYHSSKNAWTRKADIHMPRMAGTAVPIGQGHLFVLGGADGTLYHRENELKENHPGFPRQILAYHTISDTWFSAGELPANHVTTHAFKDDKGAAIIVSGEVKPRTRSPKVWKATPVQTSTTFGMGNNLAIVAYLLILVGIGLFFSFRNKSTEDFFRGGQQIPWWAAGCSIFATMLSSLTFMSIPAKAYATDWVYFLINMPIIILAPFIIHYILPFFRMINATSAYEYLELRFNLAARLFASASYILFQIGRMAIVMYLPSLALATVSPISIEASILIMGVLSIIYCTLGGLEAVIWTDTLQTFVLLGGALLSLILVLVNPDVGTSTFFNVAFDDHKFKMVELEWDYMGTALWVVILGGFAQQLIPYSSDQGVIQRYMSVSSRQKAANSIWTNAGLSLFATVLFFAVGTALYVFYKKHPEALDPTYQTDAVFPLFIARQLPVGIAGIVIAGIFAAAQSTISTSMNSISTAFTTDFIRRFNSQRTEKSYLNIARIITLVSGVLGTVFALLIASADIKSLWDTFLSVLGLFGGSMCGLFMLGIFTTKSNGNGAMIGALVGALILWSAQQYTQVSFLLYAVIGIGATFLIGLIASYFFKTPLKDINGLTIYTLDRKNE